MQVFVDPSKSLFHRDNWFKRTYRAVCSWFRYTFDKDHVKLVKEAFTGRPWDSGYLLDLEYAKIREMMNYHDRTRRFVGVEEIIRDMRICLSLIEIFTGKRNLFHYDGHLVLREATEEEKAAAGDGRVKRIDTTDDFKYNCHVKVNTRNAKRFVSDEKLMRFYEKHPHELYELKAQHLYHKIRNEKELMWWD